MVVMLISTPLGTLGAFPSPTPSRSSKSAMQKALSSLAQLLLMIGALANLATSAVHCYRVYRIYLSWRKVSPIGLRERQAVDFYPLPCSKPSTAFMHGGRLGPPADGLAACSTHHQHRCGQTLLRFNVAPVSAEGCGAHLTAELQMFRKLSTTFGEHCSLSMTGC
jgi:hypothetical protein